MNTPRGARRTDTKLSDGRELIYYDPADAPARVPLEDTRGLPAPQPQVELRTDPLTGDVITYATHRNTRTYLPPADQCPLCASKPGNPTEIPDHDYNVAVFENRFPSFAGPGRTEVVCFTSDHNQSFTDLSQGQARLVVDTWADRTAELGARDDVELVFPFENRGREIGVTLSHPHGQIYAYPFLPPRMRTLMARARQHQEVAGSNLFADVLAAERKEGSRVVARERQLDRVRARGRPLAGRGAPLPAPPGLRHRRAVGRRARRLRRALPRRTPTDSTACTATRCPTSRPGTRPRSGSTASSATCTSRCCRSAGPRTRSSTWPARSPGWARSSATPGPRTWPRPCGRWVRELFEDVFGTAPDGSWRAPGRVNLIGEHTDYNDGLVLPIALPNRIVVTASQRDDGRIAVASSRAQGRHRVRHRRADPGLRRRLGGVPGRCGLDPA